MLPDIYPYVSAIGWEWWLALGVAESLLALGSRLFEWELTRRAYIRLGVALIVVAGFLAWREERDGRVQANADTSAAKQDVARLEGQLTQAKDEITTLRAIPEQKEMQALRDEVVALRKNQADRNLSDEQRAAMVAALRTLPGKIKVYHGIAQREPAQYATQLRKAFQEAGWDVSGAQSPEYARGLVLNLSAEPTEFEQQLAALVLEAFSDADLNLPRLQRSTSVASGELLLFVGDSPS